MQAKRFDTCILNYPFTRTYNRTSIVNPNSLAKIDSLIFKNSRLTNSFEWLYRLRRNDLQFLQAEVPWLEAKEPWENLAHRLHGLCPGNLKQFWMEADEPKELPEMLMLMEFVGKVYQRLGVAVAGKERYSKLLMLYYQMVAVKRETPKDYQNSSMSTRLISPTLNLQDILLGSFSNLHEEQTITVVKQMQLKLLNKVLENRQSLQVEDFGRIIHSSLFNITDLYSFNDLLYSHVYPTLAHSSLENVLHNLLFLTRFNKIPGFYLLSCVDQLGRFASKGLCTFQEMQTMVHILHLILRKAMRLDTSDYLRDYKKMKLIMRGLLATKVEFVDCSGLARSFTMREVIKNEDKLLELFQAVTKSQYGFETVQNEVKQEAKKTFTRKNICKGQDQTYLSKMISQEIHCLSGGSAKKLDKIKFFVCCLRLVNMLAFSVEMDNTAVLQFWNFECVSSFISSYSGFGDILKECLYARDLIEKILGFQKNKWRRNQVTGNSTKKQLVNFVRKMQESLTEEKIQSDQKEKDRNQEVQTQNQENNRISHYIKDKSNKLAQFSKMLAPKVDFISSFLHKSLTICEQVSVNSAVMIEITRQPSHEILLRVDLSENLDRDIFLRFPQPLNFELSTRRAISCLRNDKTYLETLMTVGSRMTLWHALQKSEQIKTNVWVYPYYFDMEVTDLSRNKHYYKIVNMLQINAYNPRFKFDQNFYHEFKAKNLNAVIQDANQKKNSQTMFVSPD